MKKYLAFASNQYYPKGGIHDLLGIVDTQDIAMRMILDWAKSEAYSDVDAHIIEADDGVFTTVWGMVIPLTEIDALKAGKG